MTNCANNLATKDDINKILASINSSRVEIKIELANLLKELFGIKADVNRNYSNLYSKINKDDFEIKQKIDRVYNKVNNEFYQVKVDLDKLYNKVNNDDFDIKVKITNEANRIIEELKRKTGDNVEVQIRNTLNLLLAPIKVDITSIKTSINSLRAEVTIIKSSLNIGLVNLQALINSLTLNLNNLRFDVNSLEANISSFIVKFTLRINNLEIAVNKVSLIAVRLSSEVSLSFNKINSLAIAIARIESLIFFLRADSLSIMNSLSISLRNEQDIKNSLFILTIVKGLLDRLVNISSNIQVTINTVDRSIKLIDNRTINILTITNNIKNDTNILKPLVNDIKDDVKILNLPLLDGKCENDGYSEKTEVVQSIAEALSIVNKQVEDVKKAVCELEDNEAVLLPDPSAVWDTYGYYLFFFWRLADRSSQKDKRWKNKTQLYDPIDVLLNPSDPDAIWDQYFKDISQIVGNQWGQVYPESATKSRPLYSGWFLDKDEGRRFFNLIEGLTKQSFRGENNPTFTDVDSKTTRIVNVGRQTKLYKVCIGYKGKNTDEVLILQSYSASK